jgi:ABC-type glutathione transport system ATPase component
MTTNGTVGRSILQVQSLEVRYPIRRRLRDIARGRQTEELIAVREVSFDVHAGEMVVLVGQSGAGKTTVAHAILRLVEPAFGRIEFMGDDITHAEGKALRVVRRRIQLVHQNPYAALDPRFSIGETVEEPLVIHRVGTRAERAEAAGRALERVGLTPASKYRKRFPHQLSGGERQRAAIATALVLEPAVLVADEPVSMLDATVRESVLALLDELRTEGLAMLAITHDLSMAARHAQRMLVMKDGEVVDKGSPSQLLDAPTHPYTRELLAATPRLPPPNGYRSDRSATSIRLDERTRPPIHPSRERQKRD